MSETIWPESLVRKATGASVPGPFVNSIVALVGS
jgi:hypothetical protein